jgi:hypothetical protein
MATEAIKSGQRSVVRLQNSAPLCLPISQIRRMNSAEVRLTVCSFIPPCVDHIPDPP